MLEKTKLRRTNSKEFRKEMKKFLLASISTDENAGESEEEIVSDFWNRFESETEGLKNTKKSINKKNRLSYWLQGLPTDIPFMTEDILEVAKVLHEVEDFDEKTKQMIIERWWDFCSNQLIMSFK